MEVWKVHEERLARTVTRWAGRLAGRLAVREEERRTVAWVVDEFFDALATEVEATTSKKVAAGMFQMSHRTYLRQTSATRGRLGLVGSSLWWQIRDALLSEPLTREQVLYRFRRQPAETIGAILHDMEKSGWVMLVGTRFEATKTSQIWEEEHLKNFLRTFVVRRLEMPTPEVVSKLTGLPLERVKRWHQAVGQETDISAALQGDPSLEEMTFEVCRLALATSFMSIYRKFSDTAWGGKNVLCWLSYNSPTSAEKLNESWDGCLKTFVQTYKEVRESSDGEHGEHTSVWLFTHLDAGSDEFLD